MEESFEEGGFRHTVKITVKKYGQIRHLKISPSWILQVLAMLDDFINYFIYYTVTIEEDEGEVNYVQSLCDHCFSV